MSTITRLIALWTSLRNTPCSLRASLGRTASLATSGAGPSATKSAGGAAATAKRSACGDAYTGTKSAPGPATPSVVMLATIDDHGGTAKGHAPPDGPAPALDPD